MKFNLPARIERPSRRPIVLRPIQPTQAQASDLAAIYQRVVAPWRAGADKIIAAYERTLAELQFDTAEDIGNAIDEVAEEIRRVVLQLTPDLRSWALRTERVHRGKWVRNILSATQIDLSTILSVDDVGETVEEAIEWNVALIKDVSAEEQRRISNSVFAGIQQRKPAREVAKEIREATGMARARSIRIASHQTVSFGEALNDARRRQAGIDTWKWRHSGKHNFRPEHLARDGFIYSDNPERQGKTSSGERIRKPPEDRPGRLPNCGCTSQAVVVFSE